MTTVIIDDTSREGQEMLQVLREQDYATVLNDKHDWWFTISEEERKNIKAGLQDLSNGQTIPHEKVRKLYEEWL